MVTEVHTFGCFDMLLVPHKAKSHLNHTVSAPWSEQSSTLVVFHSQMPYPMAHMPLSRHLSAGAKDPAGNAQPCT